MKPIAPNTLIQNRYLIVQLIGKGGMGEVYLAVDQRLGSAVALKRTFFSDDEMLGNAFEREARTLARLRHSVLPKVSDHFTEADMQYLVMDHIAGEDLAKRLEAAQKPFPLSWVLFWADQLLDALNYLHSHEPPIVHRDIKPQNLKLTNENNIVLLDFGLSKNNAEQTHATTTGSVVGYTTQYAPMEQIRGTGTDARSDIYSLSATLYQILTNTVPADALTRADTIISGNPDPIQPINLLNPEVTETVSNVIIKGMAISQAQRFFTARAMQKALRNAYAEVKNVAAEKPAAFNTPPQIAVEQAQYSAEVVSLPISSQKADLHQSHNSQSSAAAEFDSSSQNQESGELDFDATIRFDSQPNSFPVNSQPESYPIKQSDIKTEVFISIAPAKNNSAPVEVLNENQNPAQKDNLAIAEHFGKKEKSSSDAGAEQQNDSLAQKPVLEDLEGFDAAAQPELESSAVTYVPIPNPPPAKEILPTAPVQTQKLPEKSYGKTLAVGSGLGALLVLLIGGAALGWYLLSETNTADETPKTLPQTTVEATPAPTIESVSMPDNSGVNDSVNSNIAAPVAEQTGDKIKPAAQNQSASGKVSPPKPTPQISGIKTPPKTAPKKTPAKGDRTDILQ